MRFLSLLSLLLLLFMPLGVFGQENIDKRDRLKNYRLSPTIDRSVLECIYSYKVYDPHFARTEERFWILEEGKMRSKYWSYGRYRVDSVIVNHLSCKISSRNLDRLGSKYDSRSDPLIVKDKKNGTLSYNHGFLLEYHIYEEPIPDFGWKLIGGMDTVCGYTCRKAECDFRGRKWTAWYSEIPQDNGPWKFQGLPGLILRVEDSTKEHVFEAVHVRKSCKNIGYNKAVYTQHTTREKFNKMYNEFMTNTRVFLTGSNLPVEGSPKFVERLFYSPIETSDLE
ncbi:MAG: GLPGLI family protein [Staphylococcus sp.]|nr:GLPGLI family protein [Staphylococcus sp.]